MLRAVGIGILAVVSVVVNGAIVAGVVYETVLVIAALGWLGVALHLVVPTVVFGWWAVPRLLDWWEGVRIDRAYGPIVEQRLAEARRPPRFPPTMVSRGSFAAYVAVEQRARRGA